MRKSVQDQKSFSEGMVSQAVLSRLENSYFSSVQKLENYIVAKDGGVAPRKGLTPVFTLNQSTFDEVVEYAGFRFFRDGNEIFFYY